MTSAKFLWLLRDFVPEYHHAKFGCNWTTNKGETEGGAQCAPPAYMVPKDPSPNRVKFAKSPQEIQKTRRQYKCFVWRT